MIEHQIVVTQIPLEVGQIVETLDPVPPNSPVIDAEIILVPVIKRGEEPAGKQMVEITFHARRDLSVSLHFTPNRPQFVILPPNAPPWKDKHGRDLTFVKRLSSEHILLRLG
jgi:hypothetical protein